MRRKRKQTVTRTDETGEQLVRFRKTLRYRLTLFVLGIIFLSGLVTALICVIVLAWFDKIPVVVALRLNPYFLIAICICICGLISTPISAFFGKYYLKPIKNLISATKEVRRGNFDLTVPMTSEEGARNTFSEMDLLIRNFNEMVKELGGIEMLRNDFINNFSHEFKTPIVSIRGFAKELGRADLSDAQRAEYAKIITEESDRLVSLSVSVLELSRLENQQIVTDKTEFYLDEQLRQCILRREPEWSEKGIEMLPELEEIPFFGNEELLMHIWSNLIGNAIKFTPAGGVVTVRLCDEGDFVVASIADTGVGMSEETKAHIFEKFYQGDRSHAGSGYGIGLALAFRAVHLCQGTIEVESELGQGSVFTVRLPKNLGL